MLTKLGFRLKEKECVIDRTKARQEINSEKCFFAKPSLSLASSHVLAIDQFSLSHTTAARKVEKLEKIILFLISIEEKSFFASIHWTNLASAQRIRFDIEFDNSFVLYYSSQLIIALGKKRRRQM